MAKTIPQPILLPGISSLIAQTNDQVRLFAQSDGPVFITGEVGTEKAFAAKLIHQLSDRSSRYLTKISVSWKLPADVSLYFRQCAGGTLLVNLQKEFPIDMQYTLVEMASHGAFADPMSGDVIESDVRIIMMTSLDLKSMADGSRLLPELQELYESRHVEIPPLRFRREDIPALVRYAIKRAHDTGRTPAINADPQVLTLFRQWHWPGNAEDLLLVTAQAAISCKSELVGLDDLPEDFLRQLPSEATEAARRVRSPKFKSAEYSIDTMMDQITTAHPMQTPLSIPTPRMFEERRRQPVEFGGHPAEHDTEDTELTESMRRQSAEENTPVPPAGAAATKPVDPNDTDAATKRAARVLQLARRLNAQSSILSQQMSGPLDTVPTHDLLNRLMEESTDSDALRALERELDLGLSTVLQLRRQLAVMNMRQRQSAETVRDLVQRISLSGGDSSSLAHDPEVMEEARELADNLNRIDAIVQRLSTEMPMLGKHLEDTMKGNPTAQGDQAGLFDSQRRTDEVPRLDSIETQDLDPPDVDDVDDVDQPTQY